MDSRRCADLATLRLASRTSGIVVRMDRVPEPPEMSPVADTPPKTVLVRSSVLPAISDRLIGGLSDFSRPRVVWGIVPLASERLVPTASRFFGPAGSMRQYRSQTHVVLGFQAQQAFLLPRRQIQRGDEPAHRALVDRPPPSEGFQAIVSVRNPMRAHHRLHRFAQHLPGTVQVL